ncbi:FAD-dependent oxidoreductase, partial [Endozoicomonas sp.]|uniref:FAD-dependent oxidoreductase n=1 Tax=Endozoicomonas sp. TaxID=1892382 RepID=UPI00383B3B7B
MDVKDFFPIKESEVLEWQDSSDLVIVGFGMAGASAALGGCESGASVLVLEKGSGINGTTTMAAGHFYLGGGTRPQ